VYSPCLNRSHKSGLNGHTIFGWRRAKRERSKAKQE
jgi:hypothetical protein